MTLLITKILISVASLGTIFLVTSGKVLLQDVLMRINGANNGGNKGGDNGGNQGRNKGIGIFGSPNGITVYGDVTFPYNGKLQVIGVDFPYKKSIVIVDKNEYLYEIDDSGKIEGVTKDDFPLYYSFKEPIINGSYLFKDVKFVKIIDLSKMNSSLLIDATSMFENSSVEEIYFASENYVEYFITTKIIYVTRIFLNCINLKKIIFPPFFNVGRNAREMFKGCIKLEEVNTTAIISTEIEDIESMFEDCKSLRVISFSNDFLTGEIRSLNNVFKNTNLATLDISFLRLYNLITFSNVFSGASIKGILKLGKYYSNNETRDNFFKEIARVTDSSTAIYVPRGILLYLIFQNIYYSIQKINITVTEIDIDYNINYREDKDYIIYSNYLHIGLGWAYDSGNTYDLDSSVVVFDSNIQYLNRVNFQQLIAYGGVINLNGDDLTGAVSGEGDDEEIRITLNSLPANVKFLTVQLNSYRGNILKDVKSAYIRLSTETEVIGTYSITEAGDNIGLLIGCLTKTDSNSWIFRPLNRVIPGNIVTDSVESIQENLHSIFDNK